MMDDVVLQVSDFVALINQTLEFAYPAVVIEGEVSSFNINQGKFVFFDLKDDGASIGCFMMVFHLKVPLEDGMRVRVNAVPKLTKKGRFSLTIRDVQPVGEGSLKRAYDLLKAKLEDQGLFDLARKRELPIYPGKIGVIASETSAGWADFKKLANEQWGGVEYQLAHVQVQGEGATEQIISALNYFNERTELVDVIVLLRGGGSLEDLAAFNNEDIAVAVAKSRIPTVVGVGHEVDVTLAGLAADVRAATPSNAAQIIVPDRDSVRNKVTQSARHLAQVLGGLISGRRNELMNSLRASLERLFAEYSERVVSLERSLRAYDPRMVLKRGYSITRIGKNVISSAAAVKSGDTLVVELDDAFIDSEVTRVREKTEH